MFSQITVVQSHLIQDSGFNSIEMNFIFVEPTSVTQLDAYPTGDQEVVGSTPPGWQHSVVETES